jgi:hypothetical protein
MVRYKLRDIKRVRRKFLFYLSNLRRRKLKLGGLRKFYLSFLNAIRSFPTRIKYEFLVLSQRIIDVVKSSSDVKASALYHEGAMSFAQTLNTVINLRMNLIRKVNSLSVFVLLNGEGQYLNTKSSDLVPI